MGVTPLNHRNRCFSNGEHIAGLQQRAGVGAQHVNRGVEGPQKMGTDRQDSAGFAIPEVGFFR